MQLAIDILRSELESYKQCLRTEGKYSVYPEYRGPNEDFSRNIAELHDAIAHLLKAMEEKIPSHNKQSAPVPE